MTDIYSDKHNLTEYEKLIVKVINGVANGEKWECRNKVIIDCSNCSKYCTSYCNAHNRHKMAVASEKCFSLRPDYDWRPVKIVQWFNDEMEFRKIQEYCVWPDYEVSPPSYRIDIYNRATSIKEPLKIGTKEECEEWVREHEEVNLKKALERNYISANEIANNTPEQMTWVIDNSKKKVVQTMFKEFLERAYRAAFDDHTIISVDTLNNIVADMGVENC